MTTQIRRYLFLDFDTLRQIRFKKLEKVCDKVFVFIGSDMETIPFSLVKDMQRMGANVKWIEVGGASPHDLNYHICFLMGKLHEKISAEVEFAIYQMIWLSTLWSILLTLQGVPASECGNKGWNYSRPFSRGV